MLIVMICCAYANEYALCVNANCYALCVHANDYAPFPPRYFEEHWRQSLRQWGEVWHVHEMCPVMGAHAALAFLPGHGPRRHLVSSRGQKFEQSLLTSPARRCGSPCPFFLSSSSPFSRRAFCSGPVLPRLEVPGRPSWGSAMKMGSSALKFGGGFV